MIIKAVVFDFGGVIQVGAEKSSIHIAAEILKVPVDNFRKVYFNYNHLSNTLNLPWEEMFRKVISEFDENKETIEKIQLAVRESLEQNRINTDLVALFPLLQRKGFKVAILYLG